MRPVCLGVLAQGASPRGDRDTSAIFVWVGVLIAVLLVGFVVMMWLRKRMLGADAARDQGGGFMDALRDMRNSGQMSQEEYDAARKAMASRIAGVPRTSPKSEQRPQSG
jgi:hypothetical protein